MISYLSNSFGPGFFHDNIEATYMYNDKLFWRKTIAVIYATYAVAKRKPEKNSGLYGIRTRTVYPYSDKLPLKYDLK